MTLDSIHNSCNVFLNLKILSNLLTGQLCTVNCSRGERRCWQNGKELITKRGSLNHGTKQHCLWKKAFTWLTYTWPPYLLQDNFWSRLPENNNNNNSTNRDHTPQTPISSWFVVNQYPGQIWMVPPQTSQKPKWRDLKGRGRVKNVKCKTFYKLLQCFWWTWPYFSDEKECRGKRERKHYKRQS